MKKKDEFSLEEIIRYYGSLEAYNEEQLRCCQIQIETEVRANPFTRRIKIDHARPIEAAEIKPGRRSFWLNFFSQKA